MVSLAIVQKWGTNELRYTTKAIVDVLREEREVLEVVLLGKRGANDVPAESVCLGGLGVQKNYANEL